MTDHAISGSESHDGAERSSASDTIRRPAEPWKAVERIAESDAGGWLMEFTAQALLAERQQAINELDAAEAKCERIGMNVKALYKQRREAEARCEQAIDALREIERLSRPTGPANALHPPGRVEIGSLKQASQIARAALLNLGEQP